jgi:hypothetical protein
MDATTLHRDAEPTTVIPVVPGRRPPWRGRRAALAALAGAAATTMLVGCLAARDGAPAATSPSTTAKASAQTTTSTIPSSAATTIPTIPTTPPTSGESVPSVGGSGAVTTAPTGEPSDADEDALDGQEDWHGPGDADGDPAPLPPPVPQGADDPVDLDPVGEPAGGPCATAPAGGASLLVGPDPLVLEPGTMSGTLTIANCANAGVAWTASTKPSVALGAPGGSTEPGQASELAFTIDADAWDPGAVEFRIKVSEAGHNHYVEVHAFRPTLGKDLVAGNTLTAGPTAGGCAHQCITKAAVRAGTASPDVSLDIATTVDAKLEVWVSKQAPVVANGVPSFPGVSPIASSPGATRSWLAKLSPLAPATKYYVIVRAVDANGKAAYRSGAFRTVTPAIQPGGDLLLPPSCAQQCITTARLTPGGDETVKRLEVRTNAPAMIQVSASREAPSYAGGVPSFAHSDVWVASGLEYVESWSTDLTGLHPGTAYHVIVQATDRADHSSYRVGTFHTPAPPAHDVTFEVVSIRVVSDGDRGINRGELAFAWRVGDSTVGTRGEEKLSDGDVVAFGRATSSFVANGVTEWLPTVRVAAYERDPDGLVEFCSAAAGVPDGPGASDGCDLSWNVADSGLATLEGIDSLARCTDAGADASWADRRCMVLDTPDDDTPRFRVLLAVAADA